MSSRLINSQLIWIPILGALLLGQSLLTDRLRQLDTQWLESPNEKTRMWTPELFRVVSFGHLPVAVDWLFIRFLSDPSYAKVPKGVHPPIYYDLQLATDLDPAYFEVYVLGANLLSVIRDDGAGARDLLMKGMRFIDKDLPGYPESFRKQYWNQAWYLPLSLAYVFLFELDDMPNAASAFEEAAKLPNAPAYIGRLSERLKQPGGQYEVGLRLLDFLIDGATTPEAKEKLEKRRDSLKIAHFVHQVNEAFQSYLARRGAVLPQSRQASPEKLARLWDSFLRDTRTSHKDPWGGTLSLDERGTITTSTPHDRVMGLE